MRPQPKNGGTKWEVNKLIGDIKRDEFVHGITSSTVFLGLCTRYFSPTDGGCRCIIPIPVCIIGIHENMTLVYVICSFSFSPGEVSRNIGMFRQRFI